MKTVTSILLLKTTQVHFYKRSTRDHRQISEIKQKPIDELEQYLALPCAKDVTPLLW
ncbi:4538_t:CDS:2 [Gigaspora margarita]|uniref:4538_t:CDS:1 n=1 Tax=Gigaspora margarita TaxID=4874 RepID=A0ABN7V137_GIGMA|nr:4538_t:CDS:2 [Gigaspora margarita]